MVGLTILTPTLPLITSELGVSTVAVQQLLSVYLIALAIGQLVCGPLSDRYGRRPILLAGAVLFSVSGLAAMFADGITMLTLCRTVQGFGAAACISMGRSIVNDVFERSEAARQMSTISIVLAIAPALSIAFGGVLAQSAGWQGIMALLSISGMIIFVAAWFLASETNLHRLARIDFQSVFSAYRSVLGNRLFFCWALASGLQVGVFFVLNGVLAYQYQRHGYSLAEFGMWFALTPLSYIVGNTVNRSWFVARGIERAAMTGCTLSLLSMLALFFTQSVGMTHALSLALPCCLFGFSNGIVVANATVGAISNSGNHVGTGSGIVGAWQMASGGIAGSIIVAMGGAQQFNIAASALVAMCALSVVAMFIVYRLNRTLLPAT